MAKQDRFRYAYRSNSSKLHKAVGDEIRRHPLLKHYKIYQEYPVNRINPNFPGGKCKFDFVILDLCCVIEANGRQHYEKIPHFHPNPGDFEAQQERDRLKKEAAESAGYTYITVRYDEELDVERLVNLAIKNDAPIEKKKKSSGMSQDMKDKARLIRKQKYQSKKEWLKKLKHNKDPSK